MRLIQGTAICIITSFACSVSHAEPRRADAPNRSLTTTAEPQQKLQGKKTIELATQFKDDSEISTAPQLGATNDGYATVRYAIGSSANRAYIEQVLLYMAQTLPAVFGNSSGTYTITITVKDPSGTTLVKDPIVSFQWSRERGFLFFDKTVTDVRKTSWSGTLVNQLPISTSIERLKIGIEVHAQKNRSLDFEIMKKTAKTFSNGALAALVPLPAAALPILDSVSELANAFYAGSETKTLVTEEEVSLTAPKPLKAPITFTDQNGNKFVVPIAISIESRQSRLIAGKLTNGKFDRNELTDTIFTTASIAIGDTKMVGIVELLTTANEERFKRTRALLDTLLSGGTYGRDPANVKETDLTARCNDLYDGLHRYLSKYDARAMYWAFLQRFGDSIRKEACLGPSRQADLAAVGL
jgi:hypothetical protein